MTPNTSAAPWATKRDPSGRHLLRRLLPWIGLALLLGAAAWGLWPKPVVIETGEVSRGALTVFVSEEGKTRVRNRYVVASPVAGVMHRVKLKAGDAVEAGQTVLTTIEPAIAPLIDPRSRVQAEASIAMREAARKQAQESLAALRAALHLAQTELERIRRVKATGTLSEADRDRAASAVSIKDAEVRAAGFSLLVIDHEIAQARAMLERPAAGGAANTIEIKSPVSGRVLNVMRESETPVTPGTPILEVGDPSDIEIEAEILSRDAVAIKTGDPVSIEQWGGGEPIMGRVRRVEPAAFTKISALGVEEQRVIVLSDLVNPPDRAKSLGDRYRVEVRVAVWHSDDVLTVPAGALFREGGDWKTYVYQNGVARLTDVEAGHSDGRRTVVVSGLRAGDEVLVHPPDVIKDGMAVKVRE
jgi:HlyD family secretion protein